MIVSQYFYYVIYNKCKVELWDKCIRYTILVATSCSEELVDFERPSVRAEVFFLRDFHQVFIYFLGLGLLFL